MFWVYGDNVVKRGFPMVGTVIIAINILVYLLMAGLWRQDREKAPSDIKESLAHGVYSQEEYDQLIRWYGATEYHRFIEKWGVKPSNLKQGHVMCLVSNMFVHGSLMHIFGNMLMLWALLGTLEITLGQARFLICYLVWGVGAAATQVFLTWGADVPGVGASGAIAGMVGAYLIAFGALTKVRAVFFLGFKGIYFSIPTSFFVFLWVLSQLAGIEREQRYGNTGIAWYCHAGGFALGVLTMLVFRREVLSKMIRNKSGELQALDDEERAEIDKAAAAKAEQDALFPPLAEEPTEVEELPEEELAPARKGIRPWQVMLGVAALMLIAAVFIATRKEDTRDRTAGISAKDKEIPKTDGAEYQFKGKPLATWIEGLKNEDLNARRETAAALCSIDAEGTTHLVPLLGEALKDEDAYVRRLSAYVLCNIKLDPEKAEILPSLETALRDSDKVVRRDASVVLVQIGRSKPEKLVPLLQKALADPDADVRRLGIYIYQSIDPDGTKAAALKLRVDLLAARDGFQTQRVESNFKQSGPAAKPPEDVFQSVRYTSRAGKLSAYVTRDPGDGMKRPAVLWAHGGFSGIGNYLWEPKTRKSDQSARAFREAGLVLMCPSWRGENNNPGNFELFFGEVEDLLAARDYLAKLPYVDPQRIYLAGHSTGGTLTLLAATATDKFRAAFSFGGAPDMEKLLAAGAYGNTPFDVLSAPETRLRSATLFAAAIRRPTFYFEGEDSIFNADAVVMEGRAKKAGVPFQAFMVKGGTHFDILDPITRLVARKILLDSGEACNIAFTAEEVQKAFAKRKR